MKPKFIKQEEEYTIRMKKGGIEATVFALLKDKHCWENGLTFAQLCTQVRESRKKRVTDQRIRQAISGHKKYGSKFGIYIMCAYGWIGGEKKMANKEWRYFVPKEQSDIDYEHFKLEGVKDISNLKTENLEVYETKVIPEEEKLRVLINGS